MECDKKEVPSYLHWNNRVTQSDRDYSYFHKVYRLKSIGNPISILEPWINAISCKWSKLVRRENILLQPDKKIGDDYDFAFVKEVRGYNRVRVLSAPHEFTGTHSITCVFMHSPKPCDYSHTEILIRHRVYKAGLNEPFFDEVYSYESWSNETAMLRKEKSKFFKDLKKEFRVDMIKIISRDSSNNTSISDIGAICYFIKWNKV